MCLYSQLHYPIGMAVDGNSRGGTGLVRLTILLAWILCQSREVCSIPGYGLDIALNQAKSDPLGKIDTFPTLSNSLKKSLLKDFSFDTKQKVKTLLGFESTTVINVKLVGFPGDYNTVKGSVESQFGRYIDALNQESRVSVIESELHELMVKSKINVEVSRGSKQLTDKVYNAIKAHLDSAPQSNAGAKVFYAPIQSVPYKIVDEIIEADLEKPVTSYTVYLLNTRPQERTYGYEYGPGSTTQYYPRCLGTFWTGNDRYLWVDLAAGPVEYGPSTSGEGYVKGEMFPLASSYNERQLKTAYLADLAAMVWSAARMLFVPAVRIPVAYEQETEVHIMHIQGANTTDDTKGVDVKLIEEAIVKESDRLLLPKQRLKFKYFYLKFLECPLCAAAVARAQRTYTARVFLDTYSLFVDDYLDSKHLHELLEQFGPDLVEQMKIPSAPQARVLPVYILDMDSDRQLLLDRYHQVIPFKDMILAVRSKASQVVTEYSCNGRPMVAQTRMLERPVVGALLQSLWGVAPTHLTWSPQHNSTLVDYRWALGQTPFGPFSESMSLSFAQKDAAPRNILYSMLNESISTALQLLETFEVYGGEKKFFGLKRHVEFSLRWNLYVYKLGKAVTTISHFDYETALYFIKSADHDLDAIHNLAYTASGDLVATMTCYKDPPFPWLWVISFVLLLGIASYIWFRRKQLFANKKKQF